MSDSSICVAVPVEQDQSTIAVRTGRAPHFKLFKVRDNQWTDAGFAANEHAAEHARGEPHHHGSHDEEVAHHRHQLAPLKHCQVLLVRGLGPQFKEAVELEGIRIVRLTRQMGDTLETLLSYLKTNSEVLLESP